MVPSEIAMNSMKSASQLNLVTTQTAIGIAERMTPFGASVTDLALQVRIEPTFGPPRLIFDVYKALYGCQWANFSICRSNLPIAMFAY